jgi:hypothetical protein
MSGTGQHACILTHRSSQSDSVQAFSLLRWQAGDFMLDPADFPCCDARGVCFGRHGQAATQPCGLLSRLAIVRSYARQIFKSCGQETLARVMQMTNRQLKFAVPFFVSVDRATLPEAEFRYSESVNAEAESLAVGMLAAWHFNHAVELISFRKGVFQEKLPGDAFLKFKKDRLIIIDHVERLWDADIRRFFSTLVDYCHRFQVRMWIDFPVTPEQSAAVKRGARLPAAVARKLQNSKPVSPLSQMDASTRSKLNSMLGSRYLDLNQARGVATAESFDFKP